MANTSNKKAKSAQTEDFIRIQDILHMCLSKWMWFVLSLALTMGIAVLYILRTPKVYTRTAAVLIKQDAQGKSISSDIGSFSDLGLLQPNTNVNNELIAFRSPAVMTEVVKRLHLDMNYYKPGRFHNEVAYGSSLPVTVSMCDMAENESAQFTLQLSPEQKVRLSDFVLNGEELDSQIAEGALLDTIPTPLGRILVEPKPEAFHNGPVTLYVTRTSLYSAVGAYSAKLTVGLNTETSSVVDLKMLDFSTQRAEDILNMLISVYSENWMKDRNQIAISTSMFIDERLSVIERELGNVDDDISSFKSEHLLPDVQAVSHMYMTQKSEVNSQIMELNNQLYMTRYIRGYLTNDTNKMQLLPSNSGVVGGNIESQIAEYNRMMLQRNNLVANSSEQNPIVIDIDNNLSALRDAMILSLDNRIVTLNTQIQTLRKTEQQTTSRIAANPSQAKYLLSVERQQKVKEALYLFLLQKREENELSQAFTAYNTRVVTPPHGSMAPTSPVRKNILLVAFALGLLIPLVIIFMLENMNTKLRGRKDLESLTMPLIGEIPLVAGKKSRFRLKRAKKNNTMSIVVKRDSRDIVNEAFRVLRTNLEFMTENGRNSNVIVVTSFNPGSGKSFITLNMAMSLAVKKKRVLVIDGDMRHASVSSYINSPAKGLSDYLSGHVSQLSQVIVTDSKYEQLHILPVGTIPPNPTELLFDERLREMINTLKGEYDYVLIDCPPVELVADTQIIEKFADRMIFIVRAGLLERSMIPELENIYNEKRYKNMSLILNGTESSSGRYGYRYSYRYGYGNNYHYGSDKKA